MPCVFPVLRIRIGDPGLGAFLTPGSGMGESQHPDPGSGMETVRIRDPGWKKVGSGINIPDPPHCVFLYQLIFHETEKPSSLYFTF
jgi:hypothetical protein